jgi:flavin-binding protein dodecin
MARPFERRDRGGLFTRVLGGATRSGVIVEIESVLARAGRVRDVSRETVQDICRSHGVEIEARMGTARRNLYRRFLEHCLLDHEVSTDESEDLGHLRALLGLGNDDMARVHDEVARSVYGEAVDAVLDDHKLDPDEKSFLERLRHELELPEEVASAIVEEGVERSRHRFLDKAAASENLVLATRNAPLKLSGVSDQSIEAAVANALDEATAAVPQLAWVEISTIRGEIAEGGVQRWHVELKGWLELDE